MKKWLNSIIVMLLLAGWGVTAQPEAELAQPLVFVSLPAQAWIVQQIAGNLVQVRTILRPGSNPHTYDPTAYEIKALATASLYMTIGMPFEETLAQRVTSITPQMITASMDEGIAKLGTPHTHHHHGNCCSAGGDPHIWLSPNLMKSLASNTVEILIRHLQLPAAPCNHGLRNLLGKINQIEKELHTSLKNIEIRTIVSYHPTWSYFARDYNLNLMVIEQDGKAPGARHLATIIKAAQQAKVRCVISEPQFDQRLPTILAKQIKANLYSIDPLQQDWENLMREITLAIQGINPN